MLVSTHTIKKRLRNLGRLIGIKNTRKKFLKWFEKYNRALKNLLNSSRPSFTSHFVQFSLMCTPFSHFLLSLITFAFTIKIKAVDYAKNINSETYRSQSVEAVEGNLNMRGRKMSWRLRRNKRLLADNLQSNGKLPRPKNYVSHAR